jgi:hypothetical protein
MPVVIDGTAGITVPAGTGVGANSVVVYQTSTTTLSSTSTFFSSQANTGVIGGAGQTWFINGNLAVKDNAGAANFAFQLVDASSNVYVSGALGTNSAGFEVNWHFGFVTTLSASTSFVAQARDTTSTSGLVIANSAVAGVTANKISYINAVRLS